MDELQNSTAPELEMPNPFAPYKNEAARDVYRARVLTRPAHGFCEGRPYVCA